MKKIILTLMAAAIGIGAYAVTPQVPEGQTPVKTDLSKVQVRKANDVKLVERSPLTIPVSEPTVNALFGGNEVMLIYEMPLGTYYPKYNFTKDGDEYYTKMSALGAPYVPVTYLNYTNFGDESNPNPKSGAPTPVLMSGADYEGLFTWFYNNGQKEQVSEDFTYTYQPAMFRLYGSRVPSLVFEDDAYAYGGIDEPELIINGGNGDVPDWYKEMRADAGYADFELAGCFPFNPFDDYSYTSGYASWAFGLGYDERAGMKDSYADWWGDGYEDINVTGMIQYFPNPNGAVMNLSYVDFSANVNCKKGAKLHVSFYSTNKNNQIVDLLYETDYVFTQKHTGVDTKSDIADIHIDLTYDDGVEEVNYVTTNTGIAMVIDYSEDCNKFDPILRFFDYTYYQGYEVPTPSLCAALVEATVDGEKGKYRLRPRGLIHGRDADDNFSLAVIASMNVSAGINFPVLAPYIEAESGDEVAFADSYSVNLKKGEEMIYGVYYSGDIDDIMVSNAAGDDVPEWLEVTFYGVAQSEIDYFAGIYNDDKLIPGYFYLGLKAEGEPQPETLVFNNRGAKAVFNINGGNNGIEAVGSSAAEVSAEMFDLQGRRLTVEPENGVYLRRSTLSDGTVRTSKVVR